MFTGFSAEVWELMGLTCAHSSFANTEQKIHKWQDSSVDCSTMQGTVTTICFLFCVPCWQFLGVPLTLFTFCLLTSFYIISTKSLFSFPVLKAIRYPAVWVLISSYNCFLLSSLQRWVILYLWLVYSHCDITYILNILWEIVTERWWDSSASGSPGWANLIT